MCLVGSSQVIMKSQTVVVVVVVVVVESCTRVKSWCLSRLWIIRLFLYKVSVLKKDAGYTFWSIFVCRILSALVLYLENNGCSPPSMCNILHMDTHNFMVVIVFIMAQTYLNVNFKWLNNNKEITSLTWMLLCYFLCGFSSQYFDVLQQ